MRFLPSGVVAAIFAGSMLSRWTVGAGDVSPVPPQERRSAPKVAAAVAAVPDALAARNDGLLQSASAAGGPQPDMVAYAGQQQQQFQSAAIDVMVHARLGSELDDLLNKMFVSRRDQAVVDAAARTVNAMLDPDGTLQAEVVTSLVYGHRNKRASHGVWSVSAGEVSEDEAVARWNAHDGVESAYVSAMVDIAG